MKHLVIVLFSLWTTLCLAVNDTNCGNELVGSSGRVSFPTYGEEIKRFYKRRENMDFNCLFYKTYRKTQNRPTYLKLVLRDFLVEDEPVKIKAKRGKGYHWETLYSFSNIYMSNTIISIRAAEYVNVKILVPKSLVSLDMTFHEGNDIKIADSDESHQLPGYCGAIFDTVEAINCTIQNFSTVCELRCLPGWIPTQFSGNSYPVFLGGCFREREDLNNTRNDWIKKWSGEPICVDIRNVADACSSGRPCQTTCPYVQRALEIWFNISSINEDEYFRAYFSDNEFPEQCVLLGPDDTGFESQIQNPCAKYCKADCSSQVQDEKMRCAICVFGTECNPRPGVC